MMTDAKLVAPALCALAAACAAPTPEPGPDLAYPLLSPPVAGATALPPLQPPERSQRQIETMGGAELVRWIAPGEAGRLAEAEVIASRWGRLRHVGLWESPKPAGPPGLCVATGLIVTLATDKNRLTPEQSVDPPLRPSEMSPVRRWRIAGSTLSDAPRPTPEECGTARPIYQWPETPNGAALFQAAHLIEQAQIQARQGRWSYSYRCRQAFYEEGRSDLSTRPCPSGFIQNFISDRIRRVDEADCATTLPEVRGGRCWKLDYELRDRDGYFNYTATVGGASRPKAVIIEQYIPPPH